jgi:hypothetical protein
MTKIMASVYLLALLPIDQTFEQKPLLCPIALFLLMELKLFVCDGLLNKIPYYLKEFTCCLPVVIKKKVS